MIGVDIDVLVAIEHMTEIEKVVLERRKLGQQLVVFRVDDLVLGLLGRVEFDVVLAGAAEVGSGESTKVLVSPKLGRAGR